MGWETPRPSELTFIYSLELETDDGRVGGTDGDLYFERGDAIWFGVCAEPLSARANLFSHTYLGVVCNAPYPATSDERLGRFSGPQMVMSIVVNETISYGSGAGSVRETSRIRLEKIMRDYGNRLIMKVMDAKGSMRMNLLKCGINVEEESSSCTLQHKIAHRASHAALSALHPAALTTNAVQTQLLLSQAMAYSTPFSADPCKRLKYPDFQKAVAENANAIKSEFRHLN